MLRADLAFAEDRTAVEDFFHAYIGAACQGRSTLVSAPDHKFTDVSVVSPALMRVVSLINLASVRDLATRCGRTLNPLRFRANIYVDGLAPWAELDWVDHDLGALRCRVVKRTKRCAAIDPDPDTGARDTNLPRALVANYGHPNCGIYLTVSGSGTLREGNTVARR